MTIDVDAVVQAVLSVTGGPVGLHPPHVTAADLTEVECQAWELGSYSRVDAFERQLAERCGRRFAVATSSGTAAIEVALAAVGVGPGGRVVVPALSFVAAANAVRHRGATPVFVDVEPSGFGMDPQKLNDVLDQDIRAVIAVHMLGHPCRLQEIIDAAFSRGVPVVEDAAEALGSLTPADLLDGSQRLHPCGGLGFVSVLSFNLNKIVTMGGGGAVLTDGELVAERVRRLATTVRVPHPYLVAHDDVAWNARPNMLGAALGCSQVLRLDRLVAAKRALAVEYMTVLEGIDGVQFCYEPEGTRSNYWLPTVLVPSVGDRDAVLTALNNAGFTPIPSLQPYKDGKCFPVANEVHERAVCLPAGLALAERFLR